MYRPSSSHSSSFDQPSSSTRPRRAPLNINPLPPLSSFDNIPRKQSPREISHSHSNSSDWIPPIKREPTMAVANSNQRIAIPSLLNDPIREPGRPSSSTPQIKLFECEQCFKRFTQRADVRKHKKTVHEKARDFHCEECSLSFGERGNLNKHVRSIHRKERNFLCDQCPASFPFRNGLTEHQRMKHSDDRPFECTRCPASFKKKSHLQRHTTVVHKVAP
ncbi:hypothetical protein BWQ96_01329 [Gracilariopsis chorda]|uniref:C2H2-type domain-containing protein n=1 Tax=Gracilariopsis chorda TaxID=448386 RepID=A0A2V3J366_9FLOR|nr:hypothetical protein BWQ96_01329 [Gracilariopsis chorda]|eukprot:PXF48773.1 hypothetical protein BWQ96_01329 [Gracilariopsis chorda]